MKYEVGDKVKVKGIVQEIENITQWDEYTLRYKFVGVSGWYEILRRKKDEKVCGNDICNTIVCL